MLDLVLSFHGGVTIGQIHSTFWPDDSALSTCYRRVSMLVAAGYLTATRVASFTGLGTGPTLLRPGKAAIPLLSKRLGVSIKDVRRAAQAHPGYPQHHIAVCNAAIIFQRAAVAAGASLTWIPEHQFREQPIQVMIPAGNNAKARRATVVPDGGFTLSAAGKQQRCFVEVDLATLSGARLAAKLTAYLIAQQSMHPLPVLFIVPSVQRQTQFTRLAGEAATHVSADATRLFVATTDLFSPATALTEPIWTQAGTGTLVRLLPGAPPVS